MRTTQTLVLVCAGQRQVNVCASVDERAVNTRLDVYFLTAARTTKASNVVSHQIV